MGAIIADHTSTISYTPTPANPRDKGVIIMSAMTPNPHIVDTENIGKKDPILSSGTYLINKLNEVFHTKDELNLLPSLIYDEEFPNIKVCGEEISNPFSQHVNILDKKDITKQLHDLQAIYLLTVESYGVVEEQLKKDKNATVSKMFPRAIVHLYELIYPNHDDNSYDIKPLEIEDRDKINKILRSARISKNDDGLYQIKKR